MLTQLSIGQQVRIINYNHPHCGEFVNVRSVHADGKAGLGTVLRFPGRWTSFTIEQVCLASPSRPLFGRDGMTDAARKIWEDAEKV